MSYQPRLLGLYGKVFTFGFFAQISLLSRSLGLYKNFGYRPRTRLISLYYLSLSGVSADLRDGANI